jgi:hypothetical protein
MNIKKQFELWEKNIIEKRLKDNGLYWVVEYSTAESQLIIELEEKKIKYLKELLK